MKNLKLRLPESKMYVQLFDELLSTKSDDIAIVYNYSGNEDPSTLHAALIAGWTKGLKYSQFDHIPLDNIVVRHVHMQSLWSDRRINILSSKYAGTISSKVFGSEACGNFIENCVYTVPEVVAHDFIVRTLLYCSTLRSISAIRMNMERALHYLVAKRLILEYELICTEVGISVLVLSQTKWTVETFRREGKMLLGPTPEHLNQLYGNYQRD